MNLDGADSECDSDFMMEEVRLSLVPACMNNSHTTIIKSI